uniref:Uncharacterized protein n=1 Tax=Nelumbo nucifera TaxID=4432 RepID=A0A822ZYI9_NELNU|nr:TPA_asm: hypothetical protein HUJ06_018136 [Nelumbo nucifera]
MPIPYRCVINADVKPRRTLGDQAKNQAPPLEMREEIDEEYRALTYRRIAELEERIARLEEQVANLQEQIAAKLIGKRQSK